MKRVIIPIILILILLTGCGDSELILQEDIIEAVESVVPNAEFVSMRHEEIDNDDFGQNIYTFEVDNKFKFEYTNYMREDSLFGISYNEISDQYLTELIEYKLEDIEAIAADYGIDFEEYVFKQDSETTEDTSEDIKITYGFNTTYSTRSSILWLNICINNFSDIEIIENFIDEFIEELEEYTPNRSVDNISSYNLRFDIEYKDGLDGMTTNNIHIWAQPFEIGESDTKNNIKWLEHEYAYLVRNGHIIDEYLTIEDAKQYSPMEITQLYIDGELYESAEYDIVFKLDPTDGTYYTSVIFGVDIDYNGGVKDSLQREIITEYYIDTNYTIDNSTDTTEYSIGANKYKAINTEDDDTNEYILEITRNKKPIDISISKYIDKAAVYEHYISVYNFAEIMEMSVDEIDTENGIIYLEFKEYKSDGILGGIRDWIYEQSN